MTVTRDYSVAGSASVANTSGGRGLSPMSVLWIRLVGDMWSSSLGGDLSTFFRKLFVTV